MITEKLTDLSSKVRVGNVDDLPHMRNEEKYWN